MNIFARGLFLVSRKWAIRALHVLRCEFANLTAAHRRLNGKKKRPRHLLALLLRWALAVITQRLNDGLRGLGADAR